MIWRVIQADVLDGLNAEYAEMSRWRIRDDGPLLNVPSEAAA